MKAFSVIGSHDSADVVPWIRTYEGKILLGATGPRAQLARVPAVGPGQILQMDGSLKKGQVDLETAKHGWLSNATLEGVAGSYRVRSTIDTEENEQELVLVHVQKWAKEGQGFWLRIEPDPSIQVIATGRATAGLAGRAGVADQALLVCLVGARIPYHASRKESNTIDRYWNGQYVVSALGIRSEMIGRSWVG